MADNGYVIVGVDLAYRKDSTVFYTLTQPIARNTDDEEFIWLCDPALLDPVLRAKILNHAGIGRKSPTLNYYTPYQVPEKK